MDLAQETASRVANSSPTAIRAGLQFVRESHGKGWEDAGGLARQARNDVFHSADFHEGIRAFQEKREPHWPSHPTQDLGGES